jgi:hypothetical protein
MKLRLPVTKGIIFAGCSFTWGQGLYYYSSLPTLLAGSNTFDPTLLTDSQIEFMKSVRYPRLVANHFNTFEHVDARNGGSHVSTIKWWESALGFNSENYSENTPKRPETFNDGSRLSSVAWWKNALSKNTKNPKTLDSARVPDIKASEISTVVFQLTQTHRCVKLALDENTVIPYNEAYLPKYRASFDNWLEKNNISLDEYTDYYTNESLNVVKEFLMKCEEHGMKSLIINWPRENVKFLKSDEWMNKRLVPLTHEGVDYYDMDTLMESDTSMKISTDYRNFIEPPKDDHPSLACHKLIAENLIRYLENE